MRKFLLPIVLLMMTIFLFFPQSAWAHKVLLEAKVNPEGVIKCHAHFEDSTGAACAGAKLTVYKKENGKWEKIQDFCGELDEKGNYEFGPVNPGEYKIVVEKLGHMGEAFIEVSQSKATAGKEAGTEGKAWWVVGSETTPLAYQIFSGFGYLLGAIGIATLILARRKAKGK